ncbi:DNA polymerase-3 subunit gamma/tau [Clostridium collagenovorans DSM 3089]|uniref:DNA-directed DNA polymerase n=1 Tax=Clostridium collagenovorans DSM 3089 TaxID=1121306 RepID=A0A1M5YJW2_9CLOT|nr:DNA polymerase III subunit gamma/tau [Clostridium collagenovorans]SHI12252.1 DNA polymerase-3 subunit gamma/tau [Clostridium collagenovorans DSM 3089]
MAYTALYREWRPKKFEDVVGQKAITTTLRNQIKTNKIAHAYLLCGTRGTGKTSTAKILARAVNCLNPEDGEPCNECDMCKKINNGIAIDVNELDAASNNKVEHIRQIIEEVKYPPQESRYKVYIIDEVHMLTISAVNAFLKTLEEPPSNVIFILATTDPQKLPITILSRCQRFDFKRIKSEDIFSRLRRIVDEIGVEAEDRSLKLVSRISDGAMRDALSVLDQAISMSDNKVEYESLISMLGMVTNDSLIKLVDNIIEGSTENSIRAIDDVMLAGKDVYTLIKDLTVHMRNLMMVKISDRPEEVLDMSMENIEILKAQAEKIKTEEIMRFIRILQEAEEQSKWSKQGRIYLELAVIKMIKAEFDTSQEVLLSRINKIENQIRNGEIVVSSQSISQITNKGENNLNKKVDALNKKITSKAQEQVSISSNIEVNENSNITLEKVKNSWRDILDLFKARRLMIIFASLTTGVPVKCSGGVIYISYEKNFSFNKNRLEKEENRKKVEDIFSEVLKERVRITYIVEPGEEEIKSPEELLKETFGEDVVEIID